MNIGIIGYSGSGKTSLCTLLSGRKVESFHPEEPAVTIVKIADPRLDQCAHIVNAKKTTHAEATLFDFKGAVKESGFPEGVFTKLLDCDLVVMVIGLFSDIGNTSDLSSLFFELIFRDSERIESLLDKRKADIAHGRRHVNPLEDGLLEKARECLAGEHPLYMLALSSQERNILRQFGLVSLSHFLYLINGAETPEQLPAEAEQFGVKGIVFDIGKPPTSERLTAFWDALLPQAEYLTFYTVGEKETRGWLLEKGGTALDAAGKIHTDIAKGFIRAEVTRYEDFIAVTGREHAAMRLEGKEYIVRNRDILNIRFSK